MPKQTKSRAGVASQLAIDMPTPAMLAPHAIAIADAGLTKKQADFAKLVADGAPAAKAYREAYESTGKPNTVKQEAHKLKKNPDVARTIEALKRAKELADSLSAAQIRALILSDLLKHSQNEDLKASDRLAAIGMLGKLTDVQAFTERRETVSIKASIDIREQILEKLKFIGAGSTPEASSHKPAESSREADDADSLLRELRDDPAVIDGELIERGRDFEQEGDGLEADSVAPDSNK